MEVNGSLSRIRGGGGRGGVRLQDHDVHEHAGLVTRLLWCGDDTLWLAAGVTDEEIATLRDRHLVRAPDKEAVRDLAALKVMAGVAAEAAEGYVTLGELLEAFDEEERPATVQALGRQFVRSSWRGHVTSRFIPGRSSGTKQWALTDAGRAAVGSS